MYWQVSQPKSVGLIWGLAATRCSVYIHQMNRVNSCNDFGHDDSTINIVVVINSININYVGPRICGAKKEGDAEHVKLTALLLSSPTGVLNTCFPMGVFTEHQLNWTIWTKLRTRMSRTCWAPAALVSLQPIKWTRRDGRVTGSTCFRPVQFSPVLHVHPPWRRGVVVSGVRRMNEVNARPARLVPGWVTVFGRVYHLGM